VADKLKHGNKDTNYRKSIYDPSEHRMSEHGSPAIALTETHTKGPPFEISPRNYSYMPRERGWQEMLYDLAEHRMGEHTSPIIPTTETHDIQKRSVSQEGQQYMYDPTENFHVLESLMASSGPSPEEQAAQEAGDMAANIVQEAKIQSQKKKEAMALSRMFNQTTENVKNGLQEDQKSDDQHEQDNREHLEEAKALIAEHKDPENFFGANWENLLLALGGGALALSAAPSSPGLAMVGAMIGKAGSTGIQTWHSGYNKQIDALLGKFKDTGADALSRERLGMQKEAVSSDKVEKLVKRATELAEHNPEIFKGSGKIEEFVDNSGMELTPEERQSAIDGISPFVKPGEESKIASLKLTQKKSTGFFGDNTSADVSYDDYEKLRKGGQWDEAKNLFYSTMGEVKDGKLAGVSRSFFDEKDIKWIDDYVEPKMDTVVTREEVPITDINSEQGSVFTNYESGLMKFSGMDTDLTSLISSDNEERAIEPSLKVVDEGLMTLYDTLIQWGHGVDEGLEWRKEGGEWYLYGPLGVTEESTGIARGPFRNSSQALNVGNKYTKQIKLLSQGVKTDDSPGMDVAKEKWHEAVAAQKGIDPTALKRIKIFYKNVGAD